MYERLLLKLFCIYELMKKHQHQVDRSLLSAEAKRVLNGYYRYFKETKRDNIDMEEFKVYFNEVLHPYQTTIEQEFYTEFLNRIGETESPIADAVLQTWEDKRIRDQLAILLNRENFNLEDVQALLSTYTIAASTAPPNLLKNDPTHFFVEPRRGEGIQWRLNFLNSAIGTLQKGTLMIVGAYIDVGKTAFCVSEVVHAAPQLTQPILWLNNEEHDERVFKKIWRCALQQTDESICSNLEHAQKQYIDYMGDLNKIMLINIRQMTLDQIKRLFATIKPGLVVVDQVDKIENMSFKGYTDHGRLKSLYGEFRTLANTYCPIIAVSQADVSTTAVKWHEPKENGDESAGRKEQDIFYQKWVHHRQLDGSKVGKGGEADIILMIGRQRPDTLRYLHISKNKFGMAAKGMVNFDGRYCLYTD